MPRANVKEVLDFAFPLPPLPEQERIVAILDKAFEGIDQAIAHTEQNLASARELFESYLNNIFTQRGDGWVEKKLGDVCDLAQGLAINAKTKHLLVESSSLPLLRIKDLRGGRHEQYVADEGYPEKSRVFEEDVIYTRTGQIGLVFKGRSGVLHNNSFKVTPIEELSKEFIFWFLQSPKFKKTIVALASRAAQPDITHKLFKEQFTAFPSLAEQAAIVERIEFLNKQSKQLEVLYAQKLKSLEELKQSLLQQAFAGKLTKEVAA
jgi:type I restriction enzyme S subunit